MAQTTQYGYFEAAQGQRLVTQVGRHKFLAASKSSRITIGFEKLVSGRASPVSPPTGCLKTNLVGGYIPYILGTQITQHLTRVVVVNRHTAGVSGLNYDYSLYGY